MSTIEEYRGKATLRFEDDPKGRENTVVVNYVVEQDDVRRGDIVVGGMKSWHGEFQASQLPIALHYADLVLEDGRRGRIFIREIDFIDTTKLGDEWQAVAASASGSFVGCGAAPA